MKGKKAMWKKVNSFKFEVFKFKKADDSVIGKLVKIGDGKFGKYYIIGEKLINGSAQLDAVLPDCLDKEVKIVFQGIRKIGGGKKVKVFDIYVKD